MDGSLIILFYQKVVAEKIYIFSTVLAKGSILQNFSLLSLQLAALEPRVIKICSVVWDFGNVSKTNLVHQLAFRVCWCVGYESQLLPPPVSISKTNKGIIISVHVTLC